MRRFLIYILALIFAGGLVFAADDAGMRSPFNMGAGARELALAGSAPADCDFTVAPFWNASRLADAEYYSIGVFHSYLFDTDAAYQYFGAVIPTLDYGTFGLGIFRLGVSDIEKRDINNILLGGFDDSRLGIYLAYARSLSDYNAGISITLENHSLDDYKATSTPGIDLSLSRKFVLKNSVVRNISIAIIGKNILQPEMKLVNKSVKYPIAVEFGCALTMKPFKRWDHTTILLIGLNKTEYMDPSPAFGLEYSARNILHFRSGIRNGKITFGTGVSAKGFKFDYALVDRDLGFLHMFTLTRSLGGSKKEKRLARTRQREVEFNALMNERLASQNHNTVTQLLKYGKEMLEAGDLVEASSSFDRALFIARSSGFDTTGIINYAEDAARRLDDIYKKQRYAKYLDSAQQKLNLGDYWGAKNYAEMALEEMSNSTEAQKIRTQAHGFIDKISFEEESIQQQLWAVDSLLSYGLVDKAIYMVRDLKKLAPDNSGVMQAFKKAMFEHWKRVALKDYDAGQYRRASTDLDSALSLFPGHQWCLNFQDRINNEIAKPEPMPAKIVKPAKPEPLSDELLKEVRTTYELAQELFKKGGLLTAIESWERVERLAPNFQSVRNYLVNAYKFVGVDLYGQNKLKEAVELWLKAAKLDPDNMEIANYIKRTQAEIRKLRELAHE